MLCLVDNDPYGLHIFGVYKYGGVKTSRIERERLALPSLKFVGVRGSDIDDAGVIELTSKDRKKIDMMLKTRWVQMEPEIE